MSAIEIERPLKMPGKYDFSVRKVNWDHYKKDYLLRTDAVWEKEKLKQYFYAIYKGSRIHYKENQYYKILFEHWLERMEDKDSKLDVYNNLPSKDEAYGRAVSWSDGRLFSWDMASSVFRPLRTTNLVGDRTKDGTFLCMLKFHKFMRCNEKSQVKLTEANFVTGNIADYKCYEELNELFEVCIHYHMKLLFEMYYFRVYNDYFKPMSQHRTGRKPDIFYVPEEAQKLYY